MGDMSCLEAWQAIDLVNVQLALDEQAGSVADFREACMASRKELAARTKEFKKREDVRKAEDDSALKTEVPRLLRAYQEEVDRLTQRSKFAENCFLQMYRLIREAPDPGSALSEAAKTTFDAQMCLTNLEESLAEKEKESTSLKQQVQELSKAVQTLQEIGNANTATKKDDEIDIAELEAELRKTIENETAQRYNEKLDEYRARSEEELAAVSMQLEIAQSEIDRQSELVQSFEAQYGSDFRPTGQTSSRSLVSVPSLEDEAKQLELRCKVLEEENRHLVEDLEALRQDGDSLKLQMQTLTEEMELTSSQSKERIAQLSALLDEKNAQLVDIRRQLSDSPSKEEFEKIRNQLVVIQHETFNVEYDDENSPNSNLVGAPTKPTQMDGLEAWFINSSRQLKKELMLAKRKIAEQEAEIKDLKKAEERLGEALKDQSELAAKLERDLSTASYQVGNTVDTKNALLPAIISPASSFQTSGESQSDNPADDVTPPSTKELKQDHQSQALQSMLQAVCAQRDRLRSQLQSEEERFEAQRRRGEETERKMKTLEEDNLQLYQRIRFLQNYKVSERSTLITDAAPASPSDLPDVERGHGSAVVWSQLGAAKVGGLGRGVEHKYRNLYESEANPLQAFKKQETERLYQSMPSLERNIVRVCNAFLTRSRGRVFLAVYTVFVHLLLVACLW